MKTRTSLILCALAVLGLVVVQPVQAAIYVWDANGVLGASSGAWSNAVNWNPDAVPVFVAGDTFDLSTLNITGNSSSTVDANATLGIIKIGDLTTSSHSWALKSTGGAVLTLDNISANSQINQTSTSFGDTIAVPLALKGSLDITNAAAAKPLTISGGITSSAVLGTQTISNLGAAAGGLIISGVIGDGISGGQIAITQNATGALTLAGANTYTGVTTISAGTLQAANATALGNGGDITFGGGTLQFTPLSAGQDWAARIKNSAAVIKIDTNNQNVAFAGAIAASNTGGLTKSGGGTLTLSGANVYTGTTAVSAGTLWAAQQASLPGQATLGAITVAGGATLALNAGGLNEFAGADIDNVVTNATFAANNAVLAVDTTNAGAPVVVGNIITTNHALTKFGAGTLTLTAANTYTGATILYGGNLQLSGANGATTGATAYTLAGGSLVIDNTTAAGGNNNARIADGSTIALNNGSFIYNGTDVASTNSTETVGGISGGGGRSAVTVAFGGTNVATLTAASFGHGGTNGAILVNGTNLGMDNTTAASVGRLIVTAAPTLVGTTDALTSGINAASKNTKIVPFLVGEATPGTTGKGTATGTPNTFVTYVAGSGLRPLNPTDEFSSFIAATNNTYITSNTAAGATAAINSLVINGGSLSITDGRILTNTSGALLFASTNGITSSTDGRLALGAEGMVTVNSGVTGTISVPITGTAGLTKSGAGNLTLGAAFNTNSGALTAEGGGTVSLGGYNAFSGDINVGTNSASNTLNVTGGGTDISTGANYLNIGNGVFGNNSVTISTPGNFASPSFKVHQLRLGESSSNNSLTVSNGAYYRLVTGNSGWTIGNNLGANNNSLTVTGADTVLNRSAASGSSITVGNSGSYNSLTVSAGGLVIPLRIVVGGGAGGRNNSVLVTGANSLIYINSGSNSVWTQGGAAGASNNSTTIAMGGSVFYGGSGTSRNFSVGAVVGADNNYLTVTGSGSLLKVYYSLPIGVGGNATGSTATDGGIGNHLDVVSGGSLVTNSTTSVYLMGTNSTFTLGDGTGVSTATVGATSGFIPGVFLKNGSSALNVNSGRLTAVAGGAMVSGPGSMNLNGPAYVSTFFTNSSIDSVIAGSGGLTKEGPGTLTLSNAVNTYSGGTTVSSGTLVLSGANVVPGSGTVNVSGGGTLSMADGTARATTVGGLNLVNAAAVGLDWNAAAVDTLTTSTAAVTSGKVGIVLNPTNSPSGGSLTLISSPLGGLGGASYFLANNTNYTAILDTTTTPTTAITVGTYSAGTALTSAYWYGNQVAGTNTAGVDNAMAFSNGTKSNWSSAATYAATGLVPGSAANVVFSTTDAGATQQGNVVLGAGMSVNSLTFNDTTPVTIANDGSWLTLNSTGTTTSSAISTNQDATINANVLLPGAQVFTTASGRTLTVGGNITGAGSLSIGTATIGAGTVVLSGANTYLGSTTINAGTLKAGSTTALPPTSVLTIGSTGQVGTLDLAGYSNTVAGLATGGTAASQIITNSATGTAILTVNNDYTTNSAERSFTGVLQDGGTGKVLGLTKSGSGILNLNATNTYSGGTIVNGTGTLGGILRVQTDASLGAVPASPTVNVTLNGGTLMNWNVAVALDANRTISLGAVGGYMQAGWSSNLTILGKVTGAGGLSIRNDSGWVVLANSTNDYVGNTTIESGGKLQLGTGVTGQNGAVGGTGIVDHGALAFNNFDAQSYSGTISGLGTLTKLGPGTLTLSGANTYLGATTVNAGTLRTGANDVLPMASAMTVSGNAAGVTATLDLAGNSDTIGPLTLGGSTTTSGAAVTTGVGTLTLGGDVTYANANNPLGATISGNLSLGSSLGVAARTFTVNDSASAVNDLTVSAGISGSGFGLTKAGAGTLVLSGANTYTGATTVSLGTLSFANRASLYNDVQTNWTPTNITVESAAILAVGVGDSPTYFDTTALDTLLDGTHMGQSTATTGLKTGAILGLDTTNATGGTFTRSTALANLSGGNVLNLAKVGAGELVLSGDNTYTGTTTVNAGKLTLSGNNVAATGNMAINSGGLAQFNSPASINGTARNVTVNSGGTVMFDAAFTAGSIPTALSGRIVAASAGAIAADNYDSTAFDFNTPGLTAASLGAVGTVNYTGTLTPNGTTYRLGGGGGTLTYPAAIAGANALVISGPGTVIVTGTNTYTGTTTVNGGTAKAGVISVAGVSGPFGNNSNVTLANTLGATLDLNGYDTRIGSLAGGGGTGGNVTLGAKTLTVGNTTTTTYAGVISSDAGVTGVSLNKIGTGRLNLQRANTYTGKTVIDGGTLAVDDSNGSQPDAKFGAVPAAFQADNITIKNGGTLYWVTGTDYLDLSANRGIYLDTGVQNINSSQGDWHIHGVISGPGGLLHGNIGQGGYRRLYLYGANTFTGDTKFDGTGSSSSYGGIEMNDPLALQYSAFDTSSIGSKLGNPAVLTLGGLVGTVNLAGLLNNTAVTSLTLQPQLAGVTKTYSGVLVGAAGMTLTKTGAGTQALNGLNTYTGATTIKNGVLSVNKIDVSGGNSSLGNNSLAVTLGDTSTSGTLSYTGGTASAARAFILAAGGGRIDNTTGTLTLSGGVTGTGYALTLGGAGDIILTNGIATSTGGSLIKKDAGKVTLSAANDYTGLTDIQTGTLALTGSGAIDSSPIINVASLAIFDVSGVSGGYTLGASQTLKGNGTVIGPMTAAGTVAPGSSTGTLSVTGDAALNGTFSVDVETGGASDLLAVTGNLTLGGASILSIVDTLQLNWDKKPYTIATYTGSLTGTFGGGNNLPKQWSVDYGVKTSQAITLVPEPATLVLLGLGGLGLILGRKRR